jgi:ABC-type transport system substrate-binding protein
MSALPKVACRLGQGAVLSASLLAACSAREAGGTSRPFTIGIYDTAATLGPAPGYTRDDILVAGLVFEGLTRLDSLGNPLPALAESWRTTDGRVWSIRLRDAARFHDGSAVTADAVLASWRTLLRHPRWDGPSSVLTAISGADAVRRDSMAPWSGIRLLDARSIEITLVDADAEFPVRLAMPSAWVFAAGTSTDRPIGSGPWRHVRGRARDSTLHFARAMPSGRKEADSLRVRSIPDGQPVDAILAPDDASFGVDWTIDIGTREYVSLMTRADVRLRASHPYTLRRLEISSRRPLLRDVRLRQALVHAIDRQALLSSRPGVPLELADDILPRSARPWAARHAPRYDLPRARALLRAAGYDSSSTPLRIAVNRSTVQDSLREVAWLVGNYLRAAGINIEMLLVDDEIPNNLLTQQPGADFAVTIISPATPAIRDRLRQTLGAEWGSTLRLPSDSAQRASVLRRLAALADSAVPVVGMWWQPDFVGCSLRWVECPQHVIGNRFEELHLRPARR